MEYGASLEGSKYIMPKCVADIPRGHMMVYLSVGLVVVMVMAARDDAHSHTLDSVVP